MIGVLFAFACLADGVISRNPSGWASTPRALLAASCFAACIVQVWRARVYVNPSAALVAGVMAAMAVSDFAQSPAAGRGLATFAVYGAFLAAQLAAWRDWSPDLAAAAVALAIVAVVFAAFPPPSGAWNRNVTGGTLAALIPPAVKRWGWGVGAGLVVVVALGGSRGAIVAALVGLVISARAWRAFDLVDVPGLTIGAIGLVIGMVLLRQDTFFQRFQVMHSAVLHIIAYPLFGVGQGRLFLPSPWSSFPEISAHNSALTIVAQVGIVGVIIIAASVALALRARRYKSTDAPMLSTWQIATLAAMATHSLIDDPLTWLPVGVVASIALAGEQCQ